MNRYLAGCITVLTCAAAPVMAQEADLSMSPRELARLAGAEVAAEDWQVPRTPWGDPDFTGIWPLDVVGRTSTERSPDFGTRAYYTDAEYSEALARSEEVAAGYEQEDANNEIGSGHWFEWGTPLKQVSLIMAPADGRIPPLTEQGEAMSAAMRSSWNVTQFDRISDFNSLDRCISRGLPSSMTPFPYNNGVRVFQSPGYVVLQLELVHETRVIPLERDPLPDVIRPWLGSSVGRWEGNTLVIETTNLTGKTPMNIVGPGNKPIPTSDQQTMTERLTMVGPDTIFYKAEVRDPVVLTAPYTLAFPWSRDDSYEIFEYGCHEGNTTIRGYITTTSPRFVGENAGPVDDPAEWVNDTVER